MATVRGFRTATAYVLWGGSVVLALTLAGAALLVALKADPNHALWGTWTRAVETLTPGWFARPEGTSLTGGPERDGWIRWGSAAVLALVSGAVLQWVVRPRRI